MADDKPIKPRKIRISDEVRNRRGKYTPESRSESFQLGIVSHQDMTRYSMAHGNAGVAKFAGPVGNEGRLPEPRMNHLVGLGIARGNLTNSQTIDYKDAQRHEWHAMKTMRATKTETGKGQLQPRNGGAWN